MFDERHLASMVQEFRKGDPSAQQVAAINMIFAIYESVDDLDDDDIDLTREEAVSILEELPTSLENEQTAE